MIAELVRAGFWPHLAGPVKVQGRIQSDDENKRTQLEAVAGKRDTVCTLGKPQSAQETTGEKSAEGLAAGTQGLKVNLNHDFRWRLN